MKITLHEQIYWYNRLSRTGRSPDEEFEGFCGRQKQCEQCPYGGTNSLFSCAALWKYNYLQEHLPKESSLTEQEEAILCKFDDLIANAYEMPSSIVIDTFYNYAPNKDSSTLFISIYDTYEMRIARILGISVKEMDERGRLIDEAWTEQIEHSDENREEDNDDDE